MAYGFGQARRETYDRVNSAQYFKGNILGLNAYERHQRFCRDYIQFYGTVAGESGSGTAVDQDQPRTDIDALQQGHRFIRTAVDNASNTWEARLAKRYYERLFREYCIADLSRYKESKLGLRWRTQKEVVSGKGQFSCGAKGCEEKEGLASYEVNFAYDEAGERKQALVKLRVCPSCAYRLNYRKEKQYRRAGGEAGGESGGEGGSRKRRRGSGGGEGEGAEDPMVRRAAEFVQRYVAQGLTDTDIERAAGNVAAPPPPAAGPSAGAAALGGDQQQQQAVLPADMTVWETKPVQETTAEEDFESYFDGMFL